MPALDLFMVLPQPASDGGGTARAPTGGEGRQAGEDAVFAGLLALTAEPGAQAPEAARAGTAPAMAGLLDAALIEDAPVQTKLTLPSPTPDAALHPTGPDIDEADPGAPRGPENGQDESEGAIKNAAEDDAAAALPPLPAPTPVPTDEPVRRLTADPATAAAPMIEMAVETPNATPDPAGDDVKPSVMPAQTSFQPAVTNSAANDSPGVAAAAPAMSSPAAPVPGVQPPAATVDKNVEKPDSAPQDDQTVETAPAARVAAHGTAHAPTASTTQPMPQPLPAEAGRRLEAPALPKTAPERSGDARAGDEGSAPAATPDTARNASSPPAPSAERTMGQGPSSGEPGAGGVRTEAGRTASAEAPPVPADAAAARGEPPAPGRNALPVLTSAEAASGPLPGAMTGLARTTLETTAMMAAQIVRRLESRSTRFEMALTPEDLGRVDVRMEIDGDGRLTARLAFDNPAAAAELRGRVDDLRRQLEASGFQIGEDALEFTEREGGRDQPFDRHFADREPGRAFAGAGRLIDDPSIAPPPTRWAALTLTPEGVDMKV